VNQKFWERFKSDTIYHFALKEDFEYAYTCVDYCWEDDTEEEVRIGKEEFRKNFLENFEDGASFLALGY
jgi:hypothetical protein